MLIEPLNLPEDIVDYVSRSYAEEALAKREIVKIE